jgi:hypothetical protein
MVILMMVWGADMHPGTPVASCITSPTPRSTSTLRKLWVPTLSQHTLKDETAGGAMGGKVEGSRAMSLHSWLSAWLGASAGRLGLAPDGGTWGSSRMVCSCMKWWTVRMRRRAARESRDKRSWSTLQKTMPGRWGGAERLEAKGMVEESSDRHSDSMPGRKRYYRALNMHSEDKDETDAVVGGEERAGRPALVQKQRRMEEEEREGRWVSGTDILRDSMRKPPVKVLIQE